MSRRGGDVRRSALERTLSLFAEVKAGEGLVCLLLTLDIFFVLTSYLIAKVVREPLILAGGGAEVKSYSSALQAVVLVLFLRVYALLVAHFPRRRLINTVTIFFAACLVGFYALYGMGVPIGVVYYVWVGIFSLMVIAQFWAFANDVYTAEQGKRLFVIIQFGASAGGVFGPLLARALIERLAVNDLLLVSAALLLVSLAIGNVVEARYLRRGARAAEPAPEAEPVMSRAGAFRVVFRSRYLLMIAMIILLTNWVNTTGEYVLGKAVYNAASDESVRAGLAEAQREAAVETSIGRFYAEFFSIVGLVGLLAQLFVVSRVIRYFGIKVAILFLPALAMGAYVTIAMFPVLAVIRWPKVAENATDYSLNNTVRHILFLPTTREEKYKAKVAIDSFFVRAGDVLSALVVFVGVTFLGFGIRHFAAFNLALIAVWVAFAYWTGRENQRLAAAAVAKEGEGS
jgi:AAA family ATP:ADP antiporter